MEMKISVSNGNIKMGEIKSVSLPPVITCAENCGCAKKCYAKRMCRFKNVRESYFRNLEILNTDSKEYWRQVDESMCSSRFFRMHVSGDIPNYQYLLDMVEIVGNNPHCEVLVFTKRFNFVNDYIGNGGSIPSNLHILFSDWEGLAMDNPNNLPVAHVIFKGQEPQDNWNICGGNCLECAKAKANCWTLKNGEHVAFHEH